MLAISRSINWDRRNAVCQMIRERDNRGSYDENGNTLTGDLELSISDLAALLCVTVPAVHLWKKNGHGPKHTAPAAGSVFYRLADVRHWMLNTVVGKRAREKMLLLTDPSIPAPRPTSVR